MADVRSVFVNLEDYTTKEGTPLHKALEGDAIASKNAQGALVAKDSSANFKYLEIDDAGQLKVIGGYDYGYLHAKGTSVGSATIVAIATITLTVDKVYKDLEFLGSCFRDTVFSIVQLDDTTETILLDGIRVGNSQLSFACELKSLEFTAGASGTQSLILKALNLNALSTIDGAIGIKEMA